MISFWRIARCLMTGEARRKEIRGIHRKHKFFYEMLGGGIVLVVSILIGTTHFGGENQDYRMNLFTEGMGIVATVFIINRWYAKREEESLRRRLIREAGSRSNDIAISAVEWLRREGWLCGDDGLLKGANLHKANLAGADLSEANLQGADLQDASLEKADLQGAKLHKTILYRAKLYKAGRDFAKLQEADLFAADLRGASLYLANLAGARFDGANLTGASLTAAELDNTAFRGEDVPQSVKDMDSGFKNLAARLPDGTEYVGDIDMKRFTDQFHREYKETRSKVSQQREGLG